MTRLAALATAVLISLALLALAGLASGYIGERTRAMRPPPQEYTINLQPPPRKSP